MLMEFWDLLDSGTCAVGYPIMYFFGVEWETFDVGVFIYKFS